MNTPPNTPSLPAKPFVISASPAFGKQAAASAFAEILDEARREPLTPEELQAIARRAEAYRVAISPGADASAREDLFGTVAIMCLVDVPRLLARLKELGGQE